MQNERGRECARRLQCRHKQTNATHATKTRRHATRALQAKNKMKKKSNSCVIQRLARSSRDRPVTQHSQALFLPFKNGSISVNLKLI